MDLIRSKGGASLGDLYTITEKGERNAVVKALMSAFQMTNKNVIDKLLAWGILQRQ
ncbi:MAG: hypothetical protein QM820_63835 [Minicystis sp.]